MAKIEARWIVFAHETRSASGDLALSLSCTCGWEDWADSKKAARDKTSAHLAVHAKLWEDDP